MAAFLGPVSDLLGCKAREAEDDMEFKSKFFTAREIRDHVTCISGLGGVNCYLVEGTERAALIDGLAGAGSLKAFVRELTELPVVVLNTHGHVDHIGADFEYGEVYIHPDDIGLLYEHSDREMRYGYAAGGMRHAPEGFSLRLDDIVPPCAVKTYPLCEGRLFDLGGTVLETICVPGHTCGTVVFLDRATRALFSGDACNVSTLLYGKEATSIEEYRESLVHLKEFQPGFDVMYGGHGFGPEQNVLVDEAIELCDEIMAGTDDAVPAVGIQGQPCWYAKEKDERFCRLDGKRANIAYAKDRIWRCDVEDAAN